MTGPDASHNQSVDIQSSAPQSTAGLDLITSPGNFWIRNAIIAIAYLAMALLGRALALSSGYASPLWPAAGLALAALLAWGPRCWPGVWLGAFLIDLWLDQSIAGASIAALNAAGSTLQALLGARLTRRFIDAPMPLVREQEVWRFLLLGGPLACLVSASIGMVVLYGFNRLSQGDVVSQWLIWWAGDVLGVLLITPLTLLAWPGTRWLWERGGSRLALPLLVTAALLAAGNLGLARLEENRAREAATELMAEVHESTFLALPAKIESLRGIKRFFDASDVVTRKEFAAYNTYIARQPDIQSVDWAPRVPQREHANFEKMAQRAVADGYRIYSLDAEGRPITAEKGREHFPVLFSEPADKTAVLLGLDHGFDARRLKAMDRARDSGDAAAAAMVPLLRTRQPAILVFMPVYRQGFDARTAMAPVRREALRGFVVGAYDIGKLFAPLAHEAQKRHLAFRITDVSPGEPSQVLTGAVPDGTHYDLSREMEFAGRLWRLELRSTAPYWQAGASLLARLYLAFSVFAAFLAAFAILAAAGRNAAAAALVAERTADLQAELHARQTAEAALRASEQDLETTLRSIGDGVLATDAQGRITRLNLVAEQLTGWSWTEAKGRPADEVFRIINEQTRLPAVIPIDEVLRSGEIHGLANHTVLISRNGDEHAIADSAAPIRDATGRVSGVVLVFRDVSWERAAEQALQASEARYRQLIELSPYGMLVQCEGQIVFLNQKAVSLLGGLTQSDLLGQPLLNFLHPDSRNVASERIRRINEDRLATPPLEAQWLRLDQSMFYGESTAVPYEHEGHPAGLVLLQDITDRKEAEAQLDRFFSLSLDMLCISGADGYFKRVNPAFAETLGWSAEEMLSRPLIDFVHPDDHAATMHEVRKQIDSGEKVLNFENRYRHKDGSWRLLSWRSVPQGKYMFATARDVTRQHAADEEIRRLNADLERRIGERTAALEALYNSEEELQALFDNLLDCVITIDSRGIVRSVNPMLERMLGYTADELISHNVSILMPEPHRSRHDGYLKRYIDTGVAHIIGAGREVEGLHKDGHLIPLNLAVSEFTIRGERLFIGTLRDIREHKRFVAELTQAREDAEQANRAKSAFLATMSHEIRTPMNGVIGMVDVLAHSRLTEHQTDLVGTIRESAATLLGIIDDILDFSKIEAGKLELERAPISVADLVESLCNSLVPVAARRGVDLSLFISPQIPERVLSDDVRLRQILYNLVGNALKFSAGRPEKQGRVSVRVEVAQTSPLLLAFSIADNGIGMAAKTVGGLFTPFTQAEVSTTRRFGGTGLGLAICKRLVDMMQGDIAVESTPGAGSTFSVKLPFDPAPEQPVRAQPDLSGLDCIIVQSNQLHAEDLREYLVHAGAHVNLVANVNEAAQAATSVAGTVVVLRYAGHERSAQERAFAATSNVHQLLITRGRRRRARVENPDMVTLDGDALRRQTLIRAVAVAAGRASPEIFHKSTESLVDEDAAPYSIAEARTQGRLILIAEDDDINQKVILQQLGLLGYAAEVASNGAEALRLWREGSYALLLTDLHMPEMDGYTLAGTIRKEEIGHRRIPILALTANALRGEANRARAAGMDEYLTKPVQLHLLRAALEKWLPKANGNAVTADSRQTTQDRAAIPAFNVAVLKSLIGDDDETVREFLGDYLVSTRLLSKELHAAQATGDAPQVGAIAHKLKSSSRSVGALALGDVCGELENAGRAGDKAAISKGMSRFEAALAVAETEIGAWLAKPYS
ncbi:MAG: PAS domain S-box protein [Rhodocyclales bacterium]|nr:PAS domain S-box protein [Rhodocyclales bacterium]